MNNELLILSGIAISTGLVHTILGPDHYVPFIALAKARDWSKLKTATIVLLCGLGHVSSSIIIGFLGIALGWSLSSLTAFESARGEIAGWLLIALGLVYLVYGIRYAFKNQSHEHVHFHHDDGFHVHEHQHRKEHSHVHVNEKKHTTQWVLFLIFIFGPCEPLIPIVMYPAIKHNYFGVFWVSLLFSVATLIVMLSVTLLAISGLKFVPFSRLERYTHVFASIAILFCGVAVKFLGL
ncbi:MAG: sulfite exporter TauE/SafE family protein [Candidatus Kapabacteria bacterium]|nr:sulfite exporter TauE/SafE family protein [Candidatus Kapabacteria bacterium]